MESRTAHESERRWILVVDGDVQTQRILDLSLRNAGFDVKTAGTGTEALDWLAENRPDLVVADTQLSGNVDGFELCRRLKQRPDRAAIPFVFLADPNVESKMHGVEVGADDFLTKPLYIQEVVARARALLQRREHERLELLAQGNERFIGELNDIPLIDLLRAVEANRKSGVVHLVGVKGERGEIYFRQGAVVDAEVGRLSGRDAVYRLFAWGEGRFEIDWKSIRRKDVVEMEPPALMMEALRRLEEWRRLLSDVPPLDTIFEVDYRLLAERLAEIPDEVNSILRLFDGVRTFILVIDDCGLGDLEALAVIGKLYRERIIRDVRVRPELDDVPGADIEGWLTDTAGPFRNSPQRARRELFGAGPDGGGGVHKRPTAPLDPLEDGGREALADDMRARFTDRLNAEGHGAEAASAGASDAGGADLGPAGAPAISAAGAFRPTPPLPLNIPVSEITLQGVGMPGQQQHPRPSTSPGFAAAVPAGGGARKPIPDVTPTVRATAPPTGSGDGIPEPVVVADGDQAIVIPFPGQPGSGRRTEPVLGNEEQRLVAGEIVARRPGVKARDSRASAERLAQLRETGPTATTGNRATDQGLGPSEPAEPVRFAEPLRRVEDPPPAAAASDETSDPRPRDEDSLTADEALDELGVPSRARGVLSVLVGLSLAIGGGWFLLHKRGGKEATPAAVPPAPAVAAAEPAPASAPVIAPLPTTSPAPSGGAEKEGVGSGPARSPETASVTPAVARGEAAARAGTAPVRAATPKRAPAAGAAAAEEIEERAADPKLARAAPAEFPKLLAACRTAFTEKRMKDAEGACAAAKDANPESAEAHALMAHALFNRNHRREALMWAERAVKIDPKLADAYVIIGGVRQDAGDTAEAKAAYKKYLELAPSGQYAADLRAIVDGL